MNNSKKSRKYKNENPNFFLPRDAHSVCGIAIVRCLSVMIYGHIVWVMVISKVITRIISHETSLFEALNIVDPVQVNIPNFAYRIEVGNFFSRKPAIAAYLWNGARQDQD